MPARVTLFVLSRTLQKQANSWNFYLLTIATLFSSVSLAFSHLSEPGWAVEQAEGEWDVCTLVFLNHLFESLLGCFCVGATAALCLEFMLLSCTLFQQSLQNIKWCFSLCCINSSTCLNVRMSFLGLANGSYQTVRDYAAVCDSIWWHIDSKSCW